MYSTNPTQSKVKPTRKYKYYKSKKKKKKGKQRFHIPIRATPLSQLVQVLLAILEAK
jgi:hypothetical protein